MFSLSNYCHSKRGLHCWLVKAGKSQAGVCGLKIRSSKVPKIKKTTSFSHKWLHCDWCRTKKSILRSSFKSDQRVGCYYSNRLSYWTSHFDGAAKTISITGPIFQLLIVICQNIPYVPFALPFPSTWYFPSPHFFSNGQNTLACLFLFKSSLTIDLPPWGKFLPKWLIFSVLRPW